MSNILFVTAKMEVYLRGVADNIYSSMVTDAPYGLGKEPDIVEVMRDWIEKGYHEVKNSGGMRNLEWDSFIPQPNQWKEAYRTLRPGAYGLVACGTRTQDWMVSSLRFAGFEIRDTICWHYGQGYPKSLDISKAIDDFFGALRPTQLKMVGDINNGNFVGKTISPRIEKEVTTKEAQTDEAKQWQGWGTGLKPATELWILVRKPIEKGLTVAQNILKWGTGGLNLDACRIEAENEELADGRFPSNLILDEFSVELMNQQTGIKKSGAMSRLYEYKDTGQSLGKASGITTQIHDAEEGFPSRFFYCAKPSKSEKNRGLEALYIKSVIKAEPSNSPIQRLQNMHISVKPVSLMRYFLRLITPPGGTCVDPFAGSGTTGIGSKMEGFDCVCIDQEGENTVISEARIMAWEPEPEIKLFQLSFFD